MRSTVRLFMAAFLFTLAAGVALAQDPVPPPPAPEVTQPPVVEAAPLPVPEPVVEPVPEPVVEPIVPVVEPAPVAAQPVPVVEPVVLAPVAAPPVPEKPVATTTTKRVARKAVTKPADKPVDKLAEKPTVPVSESIQEAAPAAGTAVLDTPADPPPPAAAAPAASIAPPPPAVELQAASETASGETKSEYSIGIGGWLLAGLVVAALAFGITMLRKRRTQSNTSIVDLSASSPGLKPVTVPRR